jgi:ABC-type antimicrobial peptide transport system permease subunit
MELADELRRAVSRIDKNQPLSKISAMDQVVVGSVAQRTFTLGLLSAFASLALLLAAVGIYGLISYLVSLRGQEIGVRMALGARPRDILHMILRHGMRLAVIGLMLGVVVGLGTAPAVSSLLFHVSPIDPFALAGGAVLLMLTAMFACYIPARRAANADPMVALRHE